MRAIDLYSGIGGWCLGLKMAAIEVVRSFEWWDQANATHNNNFGTCNDEVDIRRLPLESLPEDIDIVVGSPPCTQFSFSNRGGNGDIVDGLRDVHMFLRIVDFLSPEYWVMENVPRVADILSAELSRGGRLQEFAHLCPRIIVVNMAEYGLPQERKRMLAGSFPIELLESYRAVTPRATLGQVVHALRSDPVVDPVYGVRLSADNVTDNCCEPHLNEEEERMNRESKQFHPVYNLMSFPDDLDEPSRTVTATCTRVSRESIVIPDERTQGAFRRLTPRERASLQGFPITYQIDGKSYSDKLKMVGNALPPLISYYIACAVRGIPADKLRMPHECGYRHRLPARLAIEANTDVEGRDYPVKRRFRAAVPHLRFGSGMRFELVNGFDTEGTHWHVDFYYGTSKNVRTLILDRVLLDELQPTIDKLLPEGSVEVWRNELRSGLAIVTPDQVQDAWNHRGCGLHPFALVDTLGALASRIHCAFPDWGLELIRSTVADALDSDPQRSLFRGYCTCSEKARRLATWILAGFLVGGLFNETEFSRLGDHDRFVGTGIRVR